MSATKKRTIQAAVLALMLTIAYGQTTKAAKTDTEIKHVESTNGHA